MANPWFRHYCGMMRDEKLVSVAVKSKQPVERVVWVYGAILESASEIDDGGRYDLDADEAAYFLRADSTDISAILSALAASGRVVDGTVVNWSDRQFQSDKSSSRQAAYRERKRSNRSDSDDTKKESDVTPPSRDGQVTPQDTDTDTDIPNPIARDVSVDWDVLESRCRDAAGWQREPNPMLAVIGPIAGLIGSGCDLNLDVLPTIKAKAHGCRGSKTWKYFIGAIQQARDDRLGAMTAPNPSKPNGKSHAAHSKPNSITSSFAGVDAQIERMERELAALERSENERAQSAFVIS